MCRRPSLFIASQHFSNDIDRNVKLCAPIASPAKSGVSAANAGSERTTAAPARAAAPNFRNDRREWGLGIMGFLPLVEDWEPQRHREAQRPTRRPHASAQTNRIGIRYCSSEHDAPHAQAALN